eukprot:gene15696-21234_t
MLQSSIILIIFALTLVDGLLRVSNSVNNNLLICTSLKMGFGDMLKKALQNDPNLPPVQNPGLSREPVSVEVEFLPAKKVVKAYLGQNIGMIAKAANVDIKYSCKKGECGTCTVNFNGAIVRACQSSLPTVSNLKKFTIGVIPKK